MKKQILKLPSERTIDFHTLLDPGIYGLPSDAIFINGPNYNGNATILIQQCHNESATVLIHNLLASDGQIFTETCDLGLKKWSNWVQSGGGGAKGDKGDPGDSAYEIWLKAGNTGTEKEFLDSLHGKNGEKGDRGEPGQEGPQGKQGIKGDKGDPGKDGKDGKDGASGNNYLLSLSDLHLDDSSKIVNQTINYGSLNTIVKAINGNQPVLKNIVWIDIPALKQFTVTLKATVYNITGSKLASPLAGLFFLDLLFKNGTATSAKYNSSALPITSDKGYDLTELTWTTEILSSGSSGVCGLDIQFGKEAKSLNWGSLAITSLELNINLS